MNTKISLIIFVSVLIVIMICLIINDSKENFFHQVKRYFDNCGDFKGSSFSSEFCKGTYKCGHNGKSGENGQCKNVCRFDPILCDLDNLGSSDKDYKVMCSSKKNKYSTDYCSNRKNLTACNEQLLESGSTCSALGKTQICKWVGDGDTGKCVVNECKDITNKEKCNDNHHCFFVTDSNTGIEKCKSITGRDSDKGPDLYTEEIDEFGAITECHKECQEKWSTANKVNYHSNCTAVECFERCKIYASSKGQTIPNSYKPYPTGVVSTADYDKIKGEVMDKLKEENDIFSEYIKKDYDDLKNAKPDTEKMALILKEINDVKSIGNNFIQQIDQISNFQDKYSKHFNNILNNKNTEDPFARKLERLNMRLKEVKNVFGENGVIDNLQRNIENMPEYSEPYKQIISIDGQLINVTPVLFKRNTNTTGKSETPTDVFNSYKNKGPYLISTTNNSDTATPSYLYYGKTNREKDQSNSIEFNSNNSSDNWDLYHMEKNGETNMPLEILDLDYTDSTLYNKSKNFYFFIKKISTREEYDYYLLQNSNDKLLKNVPKFPFYIIESVSRPGYLLNVSKAPNGDGFLLNMNQADGLASEKFNVGVIPASCKLN